MAGKGRCSRPIGSRLLRWVPSRGLVTALLIHEGATRGCDGRQSQRLAVIGERVSRQQRSAAGRHLAYWLMTRIHHQSLHHAADQYYTVSPQAEVGQIADAAGQPWVTLQLRRGVALGHEPAAPTKLQARKHNTNFSW